MASCEKPINFLTKVCDQFGNYMSMYRKLKITEKTKDYLDLTERFEAAVKEILAGADSSSVAKAYELDFETLREEIHCYKNSGAERYEYNGSGRIFTYKEEFMLLTFLAAISSDVRCMCQTCAVKRLPCLAYHVARAKNKAYPREWDIHQRAGIDWQLHFEVNYTYEISHSFSIKCKLPQDN